MTLDARKDRTALRLKLYENGFTPLANKKQWLCLRPIKWQCHAPVTDADGPGLRAAPERNRL